MGNWAAYLPEGALEKFGGDEYMTAVLQAYGSIRKHGFYEEGTMFLLDRINALQRINENQLQEMVNQKVYTTSLEAKLGDK